MNFFTLKISQDCSYPDDLFILHYSLGFRPFTLKYFTSTQSLTVESFLGMSVKLKTAEMYDTASIYLLKHHSNQMLVEINLITNQNSRVRYGCEFVNIFVVSYTQDQYYNASDNSLDDL